MLKSDLKALWDSDSDQELPNLSARIQKLCTPKNVGQLNHASESGGPELLKSSERICKTPLQKVVHLPDENPVEKSKVCKSPNFSENIKTRIKDQTNLKDDIIPDVPLIMSSDSEDESEFITFSEIIRNTPKFYTPKNSKPLPSLNLSSESEDESFQNFSERIRNTPRLKKSIHITPCVLSDSDDEVFLNYTDPHPPKNHNSGSKSPLDFPEKKKLFSSQKVSEETVSDLPTVIPISKSWTALQRANAEEYSKLFILDTKVSKSFLRYRENIANQLFGFFNMKVFDFQLPKDMTICWKNSLKSTAGMFYSKSQNGGYFIFLSAPILTSFDRLRDTLIHEMCHAAVTIISRKKHEKHGPLWQVWASRCSLVFPFIECPSRCHSYELNYPIWYVCKKCNWRAGRFKQCAKFNKSVCKFCKGPIILETTKQIKRTY